MESTAHIQSDERNGNLHIKLNGGFSKDTAMAVTYHISRAYRGEGNVFIHTKDITEVEPQSQTMFKYMVGVLELPKDNIYLMGDKGKDICHDQGKVIIRKKHGHGSCGRCKNCKCGTQKVH